MCQGCFIAPPLASMLKTYFFTTGYDEDDRSYRTSMFYLPVVQYDHFRFFRGRQMVVLNPVFAMDNRFKLWVD